MAQVTIYLSDELEKAIRKKAQKARKSLSAYIADLASKGLQSDGWPKDFRELYGSWEGAFPAIEDPPPDERDPL